MFCAPLLLVLAGCSASPGSSHVQGEVLDHRSGEPIAGATLVLERRGWGRSDAGGRIVWDKRYRTQAVTDDHGTFSLELPGPTLLVGRGPGVLSVEADGFHALRTRVEGGARVSLHTIVDHEEGSPGGTARVGRLPEGRAFGWSFVEGRAVTEPERADLLVQDISASETRVTLTVPPGGGLLFIPLSEQEIGTPAEGHLLRFLDEPPRTPEADRLTLDSDPGTLFLRTRDRRYAKLLDSTWHYEDLLLDYDDHRLPRVGLRIAGPRSSHSFMPTWVTRRLETEFHFDAYLETGSTPVGLTLAVREER